jgi:asparagine synthase (glutamine-hydrolysing)
MCGIFAFLTFNSALRWRLAKNDCRERIIELGIEGCKKRGPEGSSFIAGNGENYDYGLGFTRLAINNVNPDGMQPFTYKVDEDSMDGIHLVCNGEIYNARQLYEELSLNNTLPPLHSDCSIILLLYRFYGIQYTLSRLDGVFSFILVDTVMGRMYVARDRLGIRSSYFGHGDILPVYRPTGDNHLRRTFVFGSNLRQTTDFFTNPNVCEFVNMRTGLNVQPITPGTYIDIDLIKESHSVNTYWSIYCHNPTSLSETQVLSSYLSLVTSLYESVKKRVITTDRPVCCLLSGGLDSSLIAALVSSIMKEHGNENKLETYSIGIEGSDDLKFAREVADHIGSDHHEIVVTAKDMFDAIPQVVAAIETYDTTTVRASVGNYLVCKYIAEHSEAKVVFNGDGADELMGGYLYFNVITDKQTHEQERMRLLNQIHFYDVLRSDKTISENGLEARTPFLDINFVSTVIEQMRSLQYVSGKEKYHIRKAIELIRPDLLPSSVLWRRKEAFSDGVSGDTKSWKDEISDRIDKLGKITKGQIDLVCLNNPDLTREQAYYKMLFQIKVVNNDDLFDSGFRRQLATRWMPRFISATDPSARTLDIY